MQIITQDFFNGLCCPPTYNFDVDSSDWAGAGIINQLTFETIVGCTCSSFVLSGNNIKAVIETGSNLALNSKNITNINYIKQVNNISIYGGITNINLNANPNININNLLFPFPDTLSNIQFAGCDLNEFKTNQQFPIGLRQLGLPGNNFYSPLWDNSILSWSTFQNQFDMMGTPLGLIINFLGGSSNLYDSSSPIGTMFASKNIIESYI
jgi:hypothetical protein